MLPCLHSYFSSNSTSSALEAFKTMGISLDTGMEFYTSTYIRSFVLIIVILSALSFGGLSMETNVKSDAADSAFGSERLNRMTDWRTNVKSSAPPSSSDDMQFSDDPFANGPCTPNRYK